MARINIVSWNINGIRAMHTKGLFEYLAAHNPDIICFQETKASPEQLPETLLQPAPYHAFYHSCRIKKGYSGVATFTKIQPSAVQREIGIERFDGEGRIIQTDFEDFVLLNVYFPNGAMAEKGRLQYKLDFYDAMLAYCEDLRRKGRKLVVCGDYNTAHTADDLARPKENKETSGFLPEEREKLDTMLRLGYVDTFREFYSGNGHYTWWSFQKFARERNIGWRIDYHFITRDLLPHLEHASIQDSVIGSDHCPVTITLSF